jgi:hypothetical protein
MATATVYLDTRRRRDDGTFPLKITVSHHGQVAHIPLGIHIRRDQWDRKRRQVAQHPLKQFYNQFLASRLADVTAALIRLKESGSFAGKTITQVRDLVQAEIMPQEAVCGDFKARWMYFTDRHTNARTRELYTATWDLLGRYCTDIDTIAFSGISRQWLEGFDAFLVGRGNNANSRSIHMRNIRAVFNDAMDAGITVAYPFRRLVPKPVPKNKVILSPMQLRMLFSADVPEHHKKYIDAFKLMFLLIGINTVDLLTTASVVNGRVEYIRAKTHRPYSIKLEPEAAEIISTWPSMNGHLISLGDRLKNYRGVTYRMNEALKSVFPGVTTYTARYSWATIAASLDIPKETIARALGHGGHSVTDIYIDFDMRKVDEANRRVIDYVLYNKK